MENIPLLKLLMSAGIGSRRQVTRLIVNGKVTVNGTVHKNFKHPVDVKNDKVAIDGKEVDLKIHKKVTIMLNKPAGILSTTSDDKGRQTVIDIIPEKYRKLNLYPAGRLDKDTTGLILLTNDGNLAYQITHPKFEIEKEYLIQIEGKLTPEAKSKLENGVELEDGITSPAIVKARRSHPYNYSITLHEGKKKQVRRMFEKVGFPVIALKRVRIGPLELGNLKEGQIKELSSKELKMFQIA